MKKMMMALALIFLIGANAHALQFTLDLSTINGSYGTYSDVFRVNVDGYANVNQSFGADKIFNDGDTFTESTILQTISYKESLTGSNMYFNSLASEGKFMYLYAEGLTGTAYNVQYGTPGDLTSVTFDYSFDAGSGDIGIYIDDDSGTLSHNLATAELVANFSLVRGDGAGDDGFLGGLANAGSTRLTGQFLDSTPDNVWIADFLDLGNLPAGYTAFASMNTTNQVIDGPNLYGLNIDGEGNIFADGFTATINSTGHFDVSVVPEPSTLILLGGGLVGLGFYARRKKK